MSKKFLTGVIVESSEMTGVAANRLATDLIEAIKKEIIETGRFSLPEFGSFSVRETPKRTALNPRTGEKVDVKAGATVRFKARRAGHRRRDRRPWRGPQPKARTRVGRRSRRPRAAACRLTRDRPDAGRTSCMAKSSGQG